MNVTWPKVTWEYSPESEAKRIFFIAQMIQSYFYSVKGFLVLPKIATNSVNTIYYPRLPINQSSYFWEQIKLSGNLEGRYDEATIQQLISELPVQEPPQEIKQQWDKIAPEFWNKLNQILPETAKNIKRLTIRQTAYGSRASGVHIKNARKNEVVIYLRFDAQLSHIPAAIFIYALSHIRKDAPMFGFTWEERQAVVDFLLCHTSLSALFPEHESTILAVRKPHHENLTKASHEYLTELGFPPKRLFQIDTDQGILLNNKVLRLRPTEQRVLSLLVEKRNQLVTATDIAARLWAE